MSRDSFESSISQLLIGAAPQHDYHRLDRRSQAFSSDFRREIQRYLCHELPWSIASDEPERSDEADFGYKEDTFEFLSVEDQTSAILTLAGLLLLTAPELVFPLGYDEYRFSDLLLDDEGLSVDALGVDAEVMTEFYEEFGAGTMRLGDFELSVPIVECEACRSTLARFMVAGPQYRSLDGTWHSTLGMLDRLIPELPADSSSAIKNRYAAGLVSRWTSALDARSSRTDTTISTIYLPGLWRPGEFYDQSPLQGSAHRLLEELFQQRTALRDLHWRTLEEIVAEILTDAGLRVTLTPRSNDGGRDIVARGELFPGEPSVVAVEVKSSPVVKLPSVRQALWANRHFPALMLVTSGRFSAGVLRERGGADTRLRLYLKDGVGLGQWIDSYAGRRHWTKDD